MADISKLFADMTCRLGRMIKVIFQALDGFLLMITQVPEQLLMIPTHRYFTQFLFGCVKNHHRMCKHFHEGRQIIHQS